MKIFRNVRQSMLLIISAALSLLFFNACYSDYGMTTADYDVVTTLYDPNYDFIKDKTYSMPDTIIHIVEEGKESDLSRKYDSFILEQVASHMNLRGFTRIMDLTQELPDVVIIIRATSTDHYNAYSSYYWGGYWGYGWGGYYPWYGGTTVYTYSTGTVLIDMLDVENFDIENEIYPTVWIAGINGLLGDTSTGTKTRLHTSISQAFIQSPYIGTSE